MHRSMSDGIKLIWANTDRITRNKLTGTARKIQERLSRITITAPDRLRNKRLGWGTDRLTAPQRTVMWNDQDAALSSMLMNRPIKITA
jgi:hypothetical protein